MAIIHSLLNKVKSIRSVPRFVPNFYSMWPFGFDERRSSAAEKTRLHSELPNHETCKILSYNIWFRSLEMHNRMKELGNLIEHYSPDVICFQEVTHYSLEIFQQSNWWKGYRCSIPNNIKSPRSYFCMQLCKLPVKSYSCIPFHSSVMGRELCIAEVETLQKPHIPLVVATTQLESRCGPHKIYSNERMDQAKMSFSLLEKHKNVIFCGDMNWGDEWEDQDGVFPLPDDWIDAWQELRPGEDGYTYNTESNKMIKSGSFTNQKRLDRFLCKLSDFRICGIEMIGMDEIPGLSYVKEMRVKGRIKELVLPVLPSDHFGLLLTISPTRTS